MIYLSYARAAYIALALSLFFVYSRKYFRHIITGGIIVLLFIWIIPKPRGEGGNLLRTSTIQSRLADYNQGIAVWKSSPLFGIGYNQLRSIKDGGYVVRPELKSVDHAGASLHSSYLIILATTGIIGAGLFALLLWGVVKQSPHMLAIWVFVGIYSIFDNILLHPFALYLLGIMSIQQSKDSL
jgi:O-antigen ligase